jgi:hypothetical protein
MKKCAKPVRQQINLLLRDPAANTNTAIPADKHKELTRALTELLLSAAQEHFPTSDGGEHDEHDEPSQAHA